MKLAKVRLKSASPYTQGKFHQTEKLDKENPADYEERTWRNKCHLNDKGNVCIPPSALKNCLRDAAQYLSISIPGKGKSLYTKHFKAGVQCLEMIDTGTHIDKVTPLRLFVPANGQTGGGKRVVRIFPTLPAWEVEVDFYILDETITEEVFRHVLSEAGKFIGIGSLRPINGGWHGRFEVVSVDWQ